MANPLTRFRTFLSRGTGRARATIVAQVGGAWGYRTAAQRNLPKFWSAYATNEVVFAAVQETTFASSIIPMVEEHLGGDNLWHMSPPNSELQERLSFPNEDESAIEFQQRHDTELVVTGNAITAEFPVRGERYGELRVLPTRNVFIERNKQTGRIENYIYDPEKAHGGPDPTLLNRPSSSSKVFRRRDIIHLKYAPDPQMNDWGMGPVAAGMDAIDADHQITLYIQEFFARGAVPPHVLVMEGNLTVEQERQIQRRWSRTSGGIDNAWQLGILSGVTGAQLQRLGLATGSREIGLQDLRYSIESRILMAMNVPPIVVGAAIGLEHATYSNYDQARAAMHEENTDPLVKKRAGGFSHYYQRRNRDLGTRVGNDLSGVLAVQMRLQERSEWATRELQSGLTQLNEARVSVGRPPHDGGDIYYVPVNLQPTPVSVIGEERVETAAEALGDRERLSAIIYEQALASAQPYGITTVPHTAVANVMLSVGPRREDESKQSYATRLLMRTHVTIVKWLEREEW
jgi:HK97 family phage portal protein